MSLRFVFLEASNIFSVQHERCKGGRSQALVSNPAQGRYELSEFLLLY